MKPRPPDFTLSDLLRDFEYRSEEGLVIRKDGYAGAIVHGRRYHRIGPKRTRYANYHLVWWIEKGEWPPEQLDHRNCDSLNDRIGNLRLATQGQNLRNMRRSRHNTSGFKGVTWDKSRGNWIAHISIGNRFKNLGRFDTPEAAHAAVITASIAVGGEFARAG
jgi:hypothetical protein